MTTLQNSALAVVAALTFVFSQTPVEAKSIKNHIKLKFSLAGLPVGRAYIDTIFDGKNYTMTINARTSGVSRLISKGKAKISSTGTVATNRTNTKRHTFQFNEGKKKGATNLNFASRSVVSENVSPPPKFRKDRVIVLPRHKKGVTDPASAAIVPVSGENADGAKVCNRTIQIYDGETRFDLDLRYKSRKPIKTKGYKGDAYVCSMRWRPIAGHRPNKKNVKAMMNNRSMEMWLAPVSGANVYMPIRLSAKTGYGTLKGYASRFVTETQ